MFNITTDVELRHKTEEEEEGEEVKEEEDERDEVRNSKTHYLCNLQACANFEVPQVAPD